MKTTTASAILLSSLALTTWAPHVSGQVIYIDFGTANDTPTLGGTWNSVSSAGDAALEDSTGTTTGIGVFLNNFSGEAFGDFWAVGDQGWVDSDATGDGFLRFNNTAQIIVQGLDPDTNYSVDLVATRAFFTGISNVGDFSIGGDFGDSSPNGNDFDARLQGHNGAVLTWNSVTPVELQPDLFGFNLDVDTTEFNAEIAVKAMRLSAVPEPREYAMVVGLALVGWAAVWRKYGRSQQGK